MSRKSDTRVTTRSSSSRIVATLAKQISDLNKQLSELRDENSTSAAAT